MEGENDLSEKGRKEESPLMDQRISKVPHTKTKIFYLVGSINLPFFIAIAALLFQTDDECNKPIRTWLLVIGIIFLITILIAVFETVTGLLTRAGSWVLIHVALLNIFQAIWFIIGSVWLFSDENCSDDWYHGYLLTLILLIFFYAYCGIIITVGFCCLCCPGIFKTILDQDIDN